MDKKHESSVDPALLAGLASRTGELINVAEDLIDTVRRDKVIRFFAVLISLVLIGGMATNIWNTTATRHNTNVIVSCTDPDGSCYKEARKSAKANVELINSTIVAATYCAKQPNINTQEQMRICVIDALSKG